jgi:hypothetical protein
MPNAFPQIVRQANDPLQAVGMTYPRLRPYLPNVQVQQGKPSAGDPRQLEFYPPWESENPNPGKITIELLRKFGQSEAANAVGGDLLHYIGAVDPRTNKPIDPQYWKMKQQLMAARTPQQQALDRRIYDGEVQRGEKRSFQDWLEQSRLDAYIRGYITPDKTDEWRKHGFYSTDPMRESVEHIKKYLTER